MEKKCGPKTKILCYPNVYHSLPSLPSLLFWTKLFSPVCYFLFKLAFFGNLFCMISSVHKQCLRNIPNPHNYIITSRCNFHYNLVQTKGNVVFHVIPIWRPPTFFVVAGELCDSCWCVWKPAGRGARLRYSSRCCQVRNSKNASYFFFLSPLMFKIVSELSLLIKFTISKTTIKMNLIQIAIEPRRRFWGMHYLKKSQTYYSCAK